MNKLVPFVLVLALVFWWSKDPTISASTSNIEFNYVVKYSGQAQESDYLPMLVALHGNGDTPDHFYETALDQLDAPMRIVLLKAPLSYGGGSAWPHNATDLAKYGTALEEVVELLAVEYPTEKKPILMGFSGGGVMAYYQALKHGDRYSSIIPVSGQLSKEAAGDDSYEIGAEVYAYHGKSDRVISINGGKNAVNLLKENGAKVDFMPFDGGHHGVFTNMKPKITKLIEKKASRLL